MTYLVTIKYGNNEREEYVEANDEQKAIAIVKASLKGQERRWATVFVG